MKVESFSRKFIKSSFCYIAAIAIIVNAGILLPVHAEVKLPTGRDEEFSQNDILFYNPDGSLATSCSSTSGSTDGNTLYNGEPVFSDSELETIKNNQPFYEKAASQYNFPWQILAVIHYREHNLERDNPANGQGVYQHTNKYFKPGPITDSEFQEQSNYTAQQISSSYGGGLDLNTEDGVKTMFFNYNGAAQAYKAQARSLGFSEEEANRGEGSPYVMNKADEKRDPNKNPSGWGQIKHDYGPIEYPANQDPGAFIMYKALGGISCSPTGGGGDLNQTAIDLAWPEDKVFLNESDKLIPTTAYKDALADTGVDKLGDNCSMAGHSCDAFVTTVFRYSGVDPNFVCCGVSNNGATWNYVTNSGNFVPVSSESDLQPGDVILSNEHISMYVEVDGVGKLAQAHHCRRTGKIDAFRQGYTKDRKIYRWKGN